MYKLCGYSIKVFKYSVLSGLLEKRVVVNMNKYFHNVFAICSPNISLYNLDLAHYKHIGVSVFTLKALKHFSICLKNYKQNDSNYSTDDKFEEESGDEEYENLVKDTMRIPDVGGHQVFVIQPHIKWGQLKRTNTTPQLQLEESVSLIKTLPNWKVIHAKTIPLLSFNKVKIFGKGNLELLTNLITSNKDISAVFISINMLSPLQQHTLEEIFKVPVFDRYSIVVQIFKVHAVTREAKIQVAMGEIPYLWSRFRFDNEDMSDKMGGGATIGGPGETYLEIKKRLLQDKVRKLKRELKKLKDQRDLLRKKRKKLELPTVAVVGYTNAGKTSLIKALTREEAMEPKDVLFATLDITVHAGTLPSGLKVLFVDTVGFLSDIPTTLIQSFIVTLEDAIQADLIIHIQDASHPDLKAQQEHVLKTLQSISLPANLIENMVTVSNKMDLVTGPMPNLGSSLQVSATLGIGLEDLKLTIEESIIKATGQVIIRIRVPNGGEEYTWLSREATVVSVTADEKDNQFAILNTIISEANLNRFKHKFISSKVEREKG